MPHHPILIVDDDPECRDAVQEALRLAGYDARSAADGQQALASLQAGPRPAVIVLDLELPVMDGEAFVAELRQRPELATIPVVLMSARPDLRRLTEVLGLSGCVTKPFDLEALLRILREAAPTA